MRTRTLCAAIVCWLSAAAVVAQPIQPGQKASLGNAQAAAIINTFNNTNVLVQVQATWTGTLTFEGSLDGAKYEPLNCTPINGTTPTTTTTTNGIWSCSVVGVNFAQARMSAYTSGAATVSFMTAYVSGGSSGGGGSSGNVTIVQGGNTASVNGSNQLLVNCGNCTGSGVSVPEDSVANSGDNVATAGAVISTALTPTAANGDYTWLKTDVNSALWVNPYAFSPSPSTYLVFRQTDGSAFLTPSVDYTHNTLLTPATTAGPAIICRSSTATPGATTADDYASLVLCDRNGRLKVDGSGFTQPVSGTVGVSNAFLLDATFTGRIPAALGAGGGLKVDGSGTALPVSGTVTANAGSGTFATSEVAPTSVLNGNRNVTTAGTRVTLTAGSTTAKGVTICAKTTNTGNIFVGDTSVSSANGRILTPGECQSLAIANLQTVNLDSAVNGEGVTYLGVN